MSVAERRYQALKEMDKLRKKGMDIQPIEIQGRRIAGTFWGKGWCGHIESFSDYANRLPRGRTYVRNGSVCHLDITRGKIEAIVSGSDLYNVTIEIEPLAAKKWRKVKRRCAGQIGTLLELLLGKLSDSVMEVVTDRTEGLFPLPKDISLDCDCPDWAVMCKHVAAVLYGVAARLDEKPELLFLLRGVDHEELISAETGAVAGSVVRSGGTGRRIADGDISDVFGIEIAPDEPARPSRKKAVAAKAAKKKKARKAAKKRKKSAKRVGQAAKSKAPGRKAPKKKAAKKAVKKATRKIPRKRSAKPTADKTTTGRVKSGRKKPSVEPEKRRTRKAGSGPSLSQLIVKALTEAGGRMKVGEIAESARRAGYTSSSKNFRNAVTARLSKMKQVRRVAPGVYALREQVASPQIDRPSV